MTQAIEILQFLHYNSEATRAEISATLTNAPSLATLKRLIAHTAYKGRIEITGPGSAARYLLFSPAHPNLADLHKICNGTCLAPLRFFNNNLFKFIIY